MTRIKVVIGANYGDEGKGLMTDYFAEQAVKENGTCIVVCSNGGAQRGHTVVTPDGKRHVFHHFGSGTFAGAETYLSGEYIINPMVWRRECEELKALGIEPFLYVNRDCRWTTPFDMFINQIAEESRGEKRHGSCGIGIWETIVRCEKGFLALEQIEKMTDEALLGYLKTVRDTYLIERLYELGIDEISREWEDLIGSEGLIRAFISDIRFMFQHMMLTDDTVIREYTDVVFENGQGLLLDQNIQEHNEHTTPSNTGLTNPAQLITSVFGKEKPDVEVCYVTRTYLTRHGAGPFSAQCDKSEINPEMVDHTNVPNPHQGTLRYGWLDRDRLRKRVEADFGRKEGWRLSLAVTHVNEYAWERIADWELDQVYLSDREDRNYVYADKN